MTPSVTGQAANAAMHSRIVGVKLCHSGQSEESAFGFERCWRRVPIGKGVETAG